MFKNIFCDTLWKVYKLNYEIEISKNFGILKRSYYEYREVLVDKFGCA